MANNYSQATVTPDIPANLVTEFEKILLSEYGFQYEDSTKNNDLYFFASDNVSDDACGFELVQINDHAAKGDEIARDMLIKLGQADISAETDDVISRFYGWPDIFQHILNKPGCEIVEIIIEGANTCSKMRQGEFGGWVSRITKTSIQHRNTADLLGQMRDELAFLEAVDIVCDSSPENPNRAIAVGIIKEYCANYEGCQG